jgi:hypothetical protein
MEVCFDDTLLDGWLAWSEELETELEEEPGEPFGFLVEQLWSLGGNEHILVELMHA